MVMTARRREPNGERNTAQQRNSATAHQVNTIIRGMSVFLGNEKQELTKENNRSITPISFRFY